MIAALAIGCDTGVPVASAPDGTLRVIGTDPVDGAEGVGRRRLFTARFDRPIAPETVHQGSVALVSGPQRLFLSLYVDPVDRRIVARPFGRIALERNVGYRFIVNKGVQAIDGQRLAERHVVRFRTGETLGDIPAPPRPGWGEVAPLLRSRCAGKAGCHGSRRPALGLDLSSAAGIRETAVGVRSRQVGNGPSGPGGVVGAPGLAGMAIVDALADGGSPATSYLMYKVLGDPHVLGDPMPPSQLGDPSRALRHGELQLLSYWILAGAPTR